MHKFNTTALTDLQNQLQTMLTNNVFSSDIEDTLNGTVFLLQVTEQHLKVLEDYFKGNLTEDIMLDKLEQNINNIINL